MPTLDVDFRIRDIQDLANADAIASLLARLGYDTNSRVKQTAGNLGITAEGTARPIRNIELMADQETLFQVYLFEVASVTVTHTRALARAFKDRAGNYLLILTSDYERLDFVLLEKQLPTATSAKAISTRQIRVRPRVLTVDRRRPTNVQLRVLRRLTYTELDPFAQYDKLISAFSIAEWSEEYFNNRALFSDYYLLHRLPEFDEWSDDPRQAFTGIKELLLAGGSKYGNKDMAELRSALFEPLFNVLGFKWENVDYHVDSGDNNSNYCLTSNEGDNKLAACLTYPWGRYLDGKDEKRDKTTPDDNPNALVVSILESGKADWAIVTNGKIWRIYSAKTHSKASNYYEIDLEELIASMGTTDAGTGEAFRYFWLLFRRQAFEQVTVEREGEQVEISFLERLLAESEDYAKELGERLKDRVFINVFPQLSAGLIEYIRQQEGRDAPLPEERLDSIFQGTLTLLYRLLFLFYAEARDLLPAKETRGYFEASLDKIRKEIRGAVGDIEDQVPDKLKRQYRKDSYELFDRLNKLFKVVDEGDTGLNVPTYNGGLFLTDPDPAVTTAEAQNALFLKQHQVPDLYLATAMDLLARDLDPKRQDLVFVDYKSLGVRQLGSIYEGLLEFKLRISDRKLGVKKSKGTEIYVPFTELTDRQKATAERQSKVVKKGSVYLENDKRERKATGSYYTPDHIVKYIVENAVGPVLEEKFEALRPKLRKAQQDRRSFFDRQKAFEKQNMKPEPDSKADLIGVDLVDEIFDVKVLDPAMGSGHFLVEAVDFVTDRTLHFLNAFPWNPVLVYLDKIRRTILDEMDGQGIAIDIKRLTDVNLLKRYVLKRCVYGVDLNPMAVELAKVSLWLDCFTLGAPLSFLDHHLRCGNSLIGVTVQEVKDALQGVMDSLFDTNKFAGLQLATNMMSQIGGLSDVTSSQVKESRQKYGQAVDALSPFKRILDIYTSKWFGNTEAKALSLLRAKEAQPLLDAKSQEDMRKALKAVPKRESEIAKAAFKAANENHLFHWELEFPEVFYGTRKGSQQAIDISDGAGFDAVIGNPPYDVLAQGQLDVDITFNISFWQGAQFSAPAMQGAKNLYKLFICRGINLLNGPNSTFAFIVPMSLLGDASTVELRRLLLSKYGILQLHAFPQKDDPKNRVFPEAKLSTCILICKRSGAGEEFNVWNHRGAFVEKETPALPMTAEHILKMDSLNAAIPTCTKQDWILAKKIFENRGLLLGEIATCFRGDMEQTKEVRAGTIGIDFEGPIVLRGSNITLYCLRKASQGEDFKIDVEKFLKRAGHSSKAYNNHNKKKIGYQRSSPQNNFRRIIAAPLPKDAFCFDTVAYVTEDSCQIDLDLLLALLNSKILDWYFRLRSTNSKVNEYQFNALPVPLIKIDRIGQPVCGIIKYEGIERLQQDLMDQCRKAGEMPGEVASAIVEMSRMIQAIEAKRKLKNRHERSFLAPESSKIQEVIDSILYRCYGLEQDEAKYIETRLTEMQ